MVVVCCHTLEAVGDQLAQAAHVCVVGCQNADGLCTCVPVTRAVPQCILGQTGCVAQLRAQRLGVFDGLGNACADGIVIEICIGDGHEQVLGDQRVDHVGYRLALGAQTSSYGTQTAGHVDQQILQVCSLGGLTAHTSTGAARAACGFLTLVAKHRIFHI